MKKFSASNVCFSLMVVALVLFVPGRSFAQEKEQIEQPTPPPPAEQAVDKATPPADGTAEKKDEKTDEKKDDKDAKLKPGIIASSGIQSNSREVVIDTDGASPGDAQLPIGASVNQTKRGKCQTTLTNNHEKNTYSLSYRVTGAEKGRQVLNQSFSSTVPPKQSVTKEFTCREGLALQVELTSGRKVN